MAAPRYHTGAYDAYRGRGLRQSHRLFTAGSSGTDGCAWSRLPDAHASVRSATDVYPWAVTSIHGTSSILAAAMRAYARRGRESPGSLAHQQGSRGHGSPPEHQARNLFPHRNNLISLGPHSRASINLNETDIATPCMTMCVVNHRKQHGIYQAHGGKNLPEGRMYEHGTTREHKPMQINARRCALHSFFRQESGKPDKEHDLRSNVTAGRPALQQHRGKRLSITDPRMQGSMQRKRTYERWTTT